MKVTQLGLLAALVAGAMFVATPALRAQDAAKDAPKREGRGNSPEAMKERRDKMATDLKLNEDQKKKVGEALKGQAEKMRELRAAGGTQEENRAKMRTLREETDKKLKEILTAEQFAQYEKDRPQGRGQGGQGKKKKAE
jgi:periplasmic protein CpxP/Spy